MTHDVPDRLQGPSRISTIVQRWSGWIATGILCAYYALTSAPGIGWFDAAEWALVIHEWGLGHPPGSPGYVLLVGILGVISPLALPKTLVLCSVVFGALVAVPIDGMLRQFGVRRVEIRLPCLVLGGLLPSVWIQGVRIELYSLATLLLFCAAYVLMQVLSETRTLRRMYVLGALLGFLLSVNPMFGLSIGLVVCAVFVYLLARTDHRFCWLDIVHTSMGAVVGLLPYAYCFVVSTASDRFIWGDWSSIESVIFYFSGQDYALNWAGEPDRFGNLNILLQYLFLDGSLFLLLFGLGVGWRAGPYRWIWIALLATSALLGFFVISNRVFYPEVPDYHGYLLPLIWTLVVGAARGISAIDKRPLLILSGLFVLTTAFVERPVWSRDLSAQRLPHALPLSLLESLPTKTVYVGASDHLVFPLMYLQSIGHRTDVTVLNSGFANSSWYWRYVGWLHPELNVPSLVTRMSRSERVNALLKLNPERPVYLESPRVASRLRLPTCPDSIGIRVGTRCGSMDVSQALELLASLWAQVPDQLDLSKRVIAKYAEDLAVTHLQRGNFSGGMELLRYGVEPLMRPKQCPIEPGRSAPRAPKLETVLIGSSRRNLIHFTALCIQMSSIKVN